MPTTEVRVYRTADGKAPLLDWLDALPHKVQDKCYAKLKRLHQLGHELRRPEADCLRDGIRELRVRHGKVHYRMLYFFHATEAVISHGLTKERRVPDSQIDLAVRRKRAYQGDPEAHSFRTSQT